MWPATRSMIGRNSVYQVCAKNQAARGVRLLLVNALEQPHLPAWQGVEALVLLGGRAFCRYCCFLSCPIWVTSLGLGCEAANFADPLFYTMFRGCPNG